MNAFNFIFSVLTVLCGYYFSKKYTHVDFKILMWLGLTNFLIECWRVYESRTLHLSGTPAHINDFVIRLYGVIALTLLFKLGYDSFYGRLWDKKDVHSNK